jgi:hypothetical protein
MGVSLTLWGNDMKDLNTEDPIRFRRLRYDKRPENANKVVEYKGPIFIQPKGFDQFPGEPPDCTWRPPKSNGSFPLRESKVDNVARLVICMLLAAVVYAVMFFFFDVPILLLPLLVLIFVGLDLSAVKKGK